MLQAGTVVESACAVWLTFGVCNMSVTSMLPILYPLSFMRLYAYYMYSNVIYGKVMLYK